MIDWKRIAERLGVNTEPEVTSVTGGDINRAFRLDLGAESYFVKVNLAALEPMFSAERYGLEAMRLTGAVRVPQVYLCGTEGEFSFLVLEYIELEGQPTPLKLAEGLAAMHAATDERYGFVCDNTIGSNPQPNPRSDDWVAFWREHRLGVQLNLALDNGLDARMVERGQALAEDLAPFFDDYRPRASLLHGDLWSGNRAADSEGNPVLYDPACYYGDHEADLAMMELFGSPEEAFFDAYGERFPIHDGYPLRRDLYNLYHVLNHANLFGGGYVHQAGQYIDRLLARIRG